MPLLTNAIITFYCACTICCGVKKNKSLIGITASGTRAKQGQTIASGNRSIPLGTKVEWNGKVYIIEDRMAKKYNYDNSERFDVYLTSHEEARKGGILKQQKIKILK